jgi:hypothetical protein
VPFCPDMRARLPSQLDTGTVSAWPPTSTSGSTSPI